MNSYTNGFKKIRLQKSRDSTEEVVKNSNEITDITNVSYNKTFYVGNKQYSLNPKYNPIQKLFDYVQYGLDSALYYIDTKQFQVDLAVDFPQIILQIIYSILEFNNKLHIQYDHDFVCLNYEHGHLEYLTHYAVVDGQLMMSECVWYQNKTMIFNKKMILAALERANDTYDILFDQQLENFKLHAPLFDMCGDDQRTIDASIIPKLCMLFVIADHAVQHITDGPNTDYINHTNFGNNITSISSLIDIRQIGDIKQLLYTNIDSYIKI